MPGQNTDIIIPNSELCARYLIALENIELFGIGVFGSVALEAAYRHGEDWLEQMLEYLENYLTQHVPEIRLILPEGTHLAWLDCRALGLGNAGLKKMFMEEARVHLEDGAVFDREGEGFLRMNIACPHSTLVEALEWIRVAFECSRVA